MIKLERKMNSLHNWVNYSNKNNLTISDLEISSKNNNLLFSRHIESDLNIYISFHVKKDNKPIAITKQVTSKPINNNIKSLKCFYEDLESINQFTYNQHLSMTYLNKSEADILDLTVGYPAIIIKKYFYVKNKLVFYEEEVACSNAFVFKEVSF